MNGERARGPHCLEERQVYMETTKIASDKTAAEVSRLLAQTGASAITIDYVESEAVSLSFEIPVDELPFKFRLPVRIDPVFRVLNLRRAPMNRDRRAPADLMQAKRVAWRQILRWVQAQLAMIDTGMVKVHEVFLPYACTPDGGTLFEAWDDRRLSLPALMQPLET